MKREIRIFLLSIGATILFLNGMSQVRSVGIPSIQNYSRKTYRASTQNWAIAQDNRGFMYFANNDGVLEYDGTSWNLFQFAEPALTRSLAVDEKGTLYTGMFNEFGSVRPDSCGKLKYHSFSSHLKEKYSDIGDIWKVFVTPEGIFFQSYTHIFQCDDKGNLLLSVSSPGNFKFLFHLGNKLYIQELGRGLFELNKGGLVFLPGTEFLKDKEIWSLLPGPGESLTIGTSRDGVFHYSEGRLTPWTGLANSLLTEYKIFSSCQLFENLYAFGTIQGGVIITSEQGELVQHLNKTNGLQNNTILSLMTDQSGNLWMGLDNGIDYAEINSPVSFLFHPEGFGAGYAVAIHNGTLYLGTNNGLFAAPWPPAFARTGPDFRLIPNTVGQVWFLGVFNGKLLCGHDNGSFQIEGMTARKISDHKGAWKFIRLSRYPETLIGGTYQGLEVFAFNKSRDSWESEKMIPGFAESSRVMEEDREGNLWMTHGFKGVFRIRIDLKNDSLIQVSFYNSKNGFVTNNYINVYKMDGDPIFTAREGIFRYNRETDSFKKDSALENLFATKEHISYIREDENRNIWFVAGSKPAVLRFDENGKYSLIKKPFESIQNQTIGGFEFIYPYSSSLVFFGIENGFAQYVPRSGQFIDIPFKAYIRKFENLNQKETFFSGNQSLPSGSRSREIPLFRYHKNSFRISFSSPRYESGKNIEYSYRLKDYSEDWSSWSSSISCGYNNLPEGNYVFEVRACDSMGNTSQSETFSFRILPPWYRSGIAWVVWVILFLLLILAIIRVIVRRIEISKRKERLRQIRAYRSKEQVYQRDALIAEKEIVNLRNEKLEAHMIHRDKELANQTLNLIQKNNFLGKVKDDLRKLERITKDEVVRQRLNQQIRRIDKEIDNENQWAVFETAFDEVHEDFLERIKEKFPLLTPREMRLCAYLKMNISSKEISSLMNISIRGVEISRYRLRKKMGIERDTNLTKFILEL
jgi:ligand-binding sensor domain-containing protein/DNA-binding CsgD family transcriptional regulator